MNTKKKILYHASPIKDRKSILENGIIPRSSNGKKIKYKNRVFLFKKFNNPPLDFVGYNDIDIWEVEIDSKTSIRKDLIAERDGYKTSVYIKKKVNPENIKLVETIAW